MSKKPLDIDYVEPLIDPEEDASPDARKKVIENFFEKAPVATKADAARFLCKHYPDISGGGHRGMLQRMYPEDQPWKTDERQCPKCDVTAEGNDEIQEVFGVRKSGGKLIAQSWCRACR